MAGRLSFVMPLVLSLLIHGLVIGVGEMVGGRGDGPRESERFQVDYSPEVRPVEKSAPLPAGGSESGVGTVSLETPDPEYRPYFEKITRAIDRYWGEPRLQEGDPRDGSLVVEFTLGETG